MAGGVFEIAFSIEENGRKRPEYSLESDLDGKITLEELLEYTKATLIVTADTVLREEQANGFDKEPVLTIDGRPGKRIENVSPLGKIEFTARISFDALLLDIWDDLQYRSKVKKGRYISSHRVFLNGQQVATDHSSFEAWINSVANGKVEIKENDFIRFVNIAPYARKLERFGITAQKSRSNLQKRRKEKRGAPSHVRVPSGAYALTARAIKAKYKRNAGIRFTFLPGSSLHLQDGPLKGSFGSGRKGKNSAGRSYLYPTIVVAVSERGIV